MKRAVNLSLDVETLDHVESIRGMVPRSTIIDALLKRGLESGDMTVVNKSGGHK